MMFFTAVLLYLVVCMPESTIGITVPSGADSVSLPCDCAKGHSEGLIRTLVWWRIHENTNESIASIGTNLNDGVGMSSGFDITVDNSLIIYNPDKEYTGNYVCDVTLNSNTSIQSEVELFVSAQGDEENPVTLHHYLVASIVVVLVFIETAFILVLWKKLRKRKPKVIPEHTCFGPLSFENGIVSHQRNKGHNRDRNSPRLLLVDLNEGHDSDSGFGDRDSIGATV